MRIEILKTYKLYIGGQFPRSESGRTFALKNDLGNVIANLCLASKKDLKNAVVVARKASATWAEKTAFNRSQICYRIAEMLESRKSQFIAELQLQGYNLQKAEQEVYDAIDLLIYYCGWADKYQALFSSVNPVSTPHLNYSTLEPVGLVGVLLNENSCFLEFIHAIIPAMIGGNTVIVLAPEKAALNAISFAEVLNSSDLPGGVINILTGDIDELAHEFGSHLDIDSILHNGINIELLTKVKIAGAENVKRIIEIKTKEAANPYYITNLQEVKTTWYAVDSLGTSGSAY